MGATPRRGRQSKIFSPKNSFQSPPPIRTQQLSRATNTFSVPEMFRISVPPNWGLDLDLNSAGPPVLLLSESSPERAFYERVLRSSKRDNVFRYTQVMMLTVRLYLALALAAQEWADVQKAASRGVGGTSVETAVASIWQIYLHIGGGGSTGAGGGEPDLERALNLEYIQVMDSLHAANLPPQWGMILKYNRFILQFHSAESAARVWSSLRPFVQRDEQETTSWTAKPQKTTVQRGPKGRSSSQGSVSKGSDPPWTTEAADDPWEEQADGVSSEHHTESEEEESAAELQDPLSAEIMGALLKRWSDAVLPVPARGAGARRGAMDLRSWHRRIRFEQVGFFFRIFEFFKTRPAQRILFARIDVVCGTMRTFRVPSMRNSPF